MALSKDQGGFGPPAFSNGNEKLVGVWRLSRPGTAAAARFYFTNREISLGITFHPLNLRQTIEEPHERA